jgi:hypothetical protein
MQHQPGGHKDAKRQVLLLVLLIAFALLSIIMLKLGLAN